MANFKFKVGEKVVFINDSGINWGEKVVTECRIDEVRGNVYRFIPTDTPWYMFSERNLFSSVDTEGIAAATVIYGPH